MIIVVGAGPAGLATAYYLQQHGLPYRVLEKHAIGYAWRNHYDRLCLNTLKDVSALPGLSMPEDYPPFPSARQFVTYLETYAQHFNLAIETGVEVQHATYTSDWELQTTRGVYHSNTLIVATGIWSTPFVPAIPGTADFTGTISLARDYRNPAPFVGKRVLLVGLGNSASDIAVELADEGIETAISIRDGAYFIEKASTAEGARAWLARFRQLSPEEAELALRQEVKTFEHLGIKAPKISPLKLNAVVGFKLPHTIEAGKIKVYPCIKEFIPNGVRFEDGQEIACDAVILATGYRPTIQFVQHALCCDGRGYPQLNGYCSTLTANLYCIGFTYPVTEGFLHSLTRVAKELVESLIADTSH